MKERNLTLDIVKGIGIALIVLGHIDNAAVNFIYLFHVSLFFIVSGYLFNPEKKAKSFFLNKFLHLFGCDGS